MTKKELLDYRNMNLELQQLEEQIARLDSKLKSAKCQKITRMPQGGRQVDDMADKIAKLIEYRTEYNKKLDELLERQEAVENAINSLLDPIQRIVMRYRYIQGLRWCDICLKVGYEERQTLRIYKKALDDICEDNKDDSKCQ